MYVITSHLYCIGRTGRRSDYRELIASRTFQSIPFPGRRIASRRDREASAQTYWRLPRRASSRTNIPAAERLALKLFDPGRVGNRKGNTAR